MNWKHKDEREIYSTSVELYNHNFYHHWDIRTTWPIFSCKFMYQILKVSKISSVKIILKVLEPLKSFNKNNFEISLCQKFPTDFDNHNNLVSISMKRAAALSLSANKSRFVRNLSIKTVLKSFSFKIHKQIVNQSSVDWSCAK